MRLYGWSVFASVFTLLAFLTQCAAAVERNYYIAAVNINWDYSANGNERNAPTYKKTVYREYDSDFKQAKSHPSWSGLLGPTIRGQEGDTIIVTFRNMADHPCSIHPHGIAYGKQSEGSLYFDNTFQFEKEDDIIYPGKGHTYYWEVTSEVAPKTADPPCVTYTYFSHTDIVKDYNTGLIGPLLICKKDSLDESGKQVNFHQELVLLFGIFDEDNTWYNKEEPSLLKNLKYTINGFTNGSVPDLSICAHSKVTWHMLAMSSESELFSIHFNGQVLQQGGHKVSSVGLISSGATSAEMVAIYPGRWLLSSHVSKHLEAGMHGFLDINMCEDFTAPKRKITIQQKRESQEWTYYLAAEEITWDYAPDMPDNVDGDFQSTYLKQTAVKIGKKYKKAVFTQYKDELFTDRAEIKQRKKELGILGPVIRAQIRDKIKIVFKNMASRPYSIYPHGLRIDKEAEGANYPKGGNQSHAVQPGETYTYVWKVIEEDEPSDSDSRCLTRMYHSAVNTPRDIASGLIGPLLICKSQSLNTRNVQLRADKEQHAVFAVFDENKSWYLNENVNLYCGEPKKVNTDDPEFYNSNVMHTINGYVYESGHELGFCNGEIATWHVSSIGEQDDIQTITFYGHTFELNNREEDILQLFPMTGETISMDMANIGVWLLASLNTHETKKGLRLKFKDVECYRDYFVDNDDDSDKEDEVFPETFTVWKPKDEADLKKEKAKPTAKTAMILDTDTDDYADILGIRSLKNNENNQNHEELLDLSRLDSNGGVLYEVSVPSPTDMIQNITSSGFDFIENNFTSVDFQNDSKTERLLKINSEIDPYNSTISEANNSSSNSSFKLFQQHIDFNTSSKEIQKTSESYEGNTAEKQTQELALLSIVELEEEEDGRSSENIFVYNVPAPKSPDNMAEVQDVEKFVLLHGAKETEITNHENFVEYNITYIKPPTKTINEFLEITAKTKTLSEGQSLNHTNTMLKLLDKNDTTINGSKVDFLMDTNKINSSHVDTDKIVQNYQKLNNTLLDLKVMPRDIEESNGTQSESAFLKDELNIKEINRSHANFTLWKSNGLNRIHNESELFLDFQELNKTHVEAKSQEEELKEMNQTNVDPERFEELYNAHVNSQIMLEDVQDLNRTQTPAVISLKNLNKINSSFVDKEMTLDEYKELNSTLMDSGVTPKVVEESISTQVESAFFEKEFIEINRSLVNFTLMEHNGLNRTHNTLELQEMNKTYVNAKSQGEDLKEMDRDRLKEINKTHVNSEIILEDVEELNRTQIDGKFSLEDQKNKNSSHVNADFTQDTEINSTHMNPENTLESIKNYSLPTFSAQESNSSKMDSENSTEQFSSESFRNITFVNVGLNQSSQISNFTQTDILLQSNSSREEKTSDVPGYEDSHEEVVIYLKNSNLSKVILSSPLNPQEKNWTYESKHELESEEFPSDLYKYIIDKQPNQISKTKEKKVVLQRVAPKKGHGMKTKKRKEYRPQARSAISSQGFSPRGFNPSHLSQMTTNHVSNEEDMQANNIVIGFTRTDFNDYELHVPGHGQNFDFDNIPDNTEQYEYVQYIDPYKKHDDLNSNALDDVSKYTLQMAGSKARVYFITAEEVNWDYAGYGQRREDRTSRKDRHTVFKKVLFREYLDSSFTTPYTRGELDEHLGIMGPVLKAEVDETIYIVFKNRASRPYSLHANGVSYTKNMEGLKYEDESPYYYEYDNEVHPNQTFTYIWTVNSKVGPTNDESDCRIWTYYSGVNPERDINSGLIGPLLVCRKGTLDKNPEESRDFMLLFMTFDENKSWYYEINKEIIKKTDKRAVTSPEFNNNLKFPAINGIIYSLKGLRMYADQLVNWHLINMGSSKDFHSIHFHGQTFIIKHKEDHRQGVYQLLPGGFATLEMWPSKPGLWLLESEVGISQQRGMQTLFLVLDKVCDHPLGLISGTVKDSQITASDSRGSWHSSLARLHNIGKYNAWSTTMSGQWIQVDFQRPVVISKIATQGAKQMMTSHFVVNYTMSYSTDRKKWIFHKGDSKAFRKTFEGNNDAYEIKENIFFPPIIGRFVRLYPSSSYNYPTVRMELYGCELDGCSVPLGMQSGLIEDHQISASSVASSWYSGPWQPWFARLNKQGTVNAWQAKNNDIYPWLQVELNDVKKITGIVTQGAKTLGKEMFVTTYVLQYSDDGKKWFPYSDDENYELKTFVGNSDNNGQVKNYIYPPIFSKFIRIIPILWKNAITMRIELLGCNFE